MDRPPVHFHITTTAINVAAIYFAINGRLDLAVMFVTCPVLLRMLLVITPGCHMPSCANYSSLGVVLHTTCSLHTCWVPGCGKFAGMYRLGCSLVCSDHTCEIPECNELIGPYLSSKLCLQHGR